MKKRKKKRKKIVDTSFKNFNAYFVIATAKMENNWKLIEIIEINLKRADKFKFCKSLII